jgi:hypothetical protein
VVVIYCDLVDIPNQDSFLLAAQLLSVAAFLISWTSGAYTAAAYPMVAAFANGVIGVSYIVTPDNGICTPVWNGPWYDDEMIEPSDSCHDLWGVLAIADCVLWVLKAYLSILFAPAPDPTTTTLPNGARPKLCACLRVLENNASLWSVCPLLVCCALHSSHGLHLLVYCLIPAFTVTVL